MAVKGYSTFYKAPGVEHHHQIVLCPVEMHSVYFTATFCWLGNFLFSLLLIWVICFNGKYANMDGSLTFAKYSMVWHQARNMRYPENLDFVMEKSLPKETIFILVSLILTRCHTLVSLGWTSFSIGFHSWKTIEMIFLF